MAARTWRGVLQMRPVSTSSITHELPAVCARCCDPPPLVIVPIFTSACGSKLAYGTGEEFGSGANGPPHVGSEQNASEWHATDLRPERLKLPDSHRETWRGSVVSTGHRTCLT